MSGPLGRLGAAATLGQHCPQMTQRPGIPAHFVDACIDLSASKFDFPRKPMSRRTLRFAVYFVSVELDNMAYKIY